LDAAPAAPYVFTVRQFMFADPRKSVDGHLPHASEDMEGNE
jgi:hypothetical protein